MQLMSAGNSGTRLIILWTGRDGIENDALTRPLTPEEVMEQKQLREEMYAALMQLPFIQAQRIYARFYLGMTVAEIAKVEGVDRRRRGQVSGVV